MWVKCLNLKRRRISPSLLELCLEFLHSRGKACRILDCLSAGEISRALSDLVLRSASPLQLAYFESEFPNLVAELEEVDHWNWRDLIRGWMQEIVANCWTQNSGRNEFVEVIKLHFIRVNLSLKDCQVWENCKAKFN